MSSHPPIKLSCLRDIGWKEWDPIGLLAIGELWDGQPFAGEYDGYLLHVAGTLRRKGTVDDAVAYLLWAERDNMGLGIRPKQEDRARTTALAIGQYMAELDGGEPPKA